MNSPAGLTTPGRGQPLETLMQCTCEQDKPGPCHELDAAALAGALADDYARMIEHGTA